MRRTRPRRPPGNVTTPIPVPDPLPGLAAPTQPSARTTEEPPTRVGWGWRLALFLWGASFVFLFLYEILMSLFPGNAK